MHNFNWLKRQNCSTFGVPFWRRTMPKESYSTKDFCFARSFRRQTNKNSRKCHSMKRSKRSENFGQQGKSPSKWANLNDSSAIKLFFRLTNHRTVLTNLAVIARASVQLDSNLVEHFFEQFIQLYCCIFFKIKHACNISKRLRQKCMFQNESMQM